MEIICAVLLWTIVFFILDSIVVLDDENYSIPKKALKIFINVCVIVICSYAFVNVVLMAN